MGFEFQPWPKTPRLNRDMVITEKIDGTNACVLVSDDGLEVGAQSRKRIITPDDDNFGFAKWVYENAGKLAHLLGPGTHFGEWWGSGIQRGYGLPKGEKRFSLFNTSRWDEVDTSVVEGLSSVPILYQGAFNTETVFYYVDKLRSIGSSVAPFMDPEGVIVFLPAANQCFKVTIKNDEAPKGLVA